ncbi:hypothetical protein CEP54_002747 [Fusarium duplospermum]|uniref:DUF6594 domain-containing protein n=1 Tax=Fusarium duplospermum TaxID=1325734 RepID=A0A428QTK2_9HYPO|nr:hypothetical protein CEP54_002747 [Fusarium duplospermum]
MPGIDDVEMSSGTNFEPKLLGFAAVASLMASDKDQDLLIFRKFDKMSARNLLYLQCELLAIEDQLKRWDKKISRCRDIDLEEIAETWEVMIKEAEEGRSEAVELMALIIQLRAKIKEYHIEEDLVSLKAPVETDPLSRALRAHWPGKEETSRDGVSRISRANEGSITTTVTVFNIIVAIILLVGPITSLSFVSSRPAVLGMICSFTVAFATSVGLMTNAKRAEIFAGSAA